MTITRFTVARGFLLASVASVAAAAGACSGTPGHDTVAEAATPVPGVVYTVHDTIVDAAFDASGTAAPIQQATLSTKLMGTVLSVMVREGDLVRAGQPLLRIDARELVAREGQVAASIAEAEAMHRDAATQAARIRALHTDSAATRAQLDAAETGLARADAALRAARAAASELGATSTYATITAPFGGVVTRRHVDAGAFATPGAPLLTVQDVSRLRITATVAPDVAQPIRRGQTLTATIEGRVHGAVVEGVVPAAAGNLHSVNAIVANPGGGILAGSAATLAIPTGARQALVIPAAAVIREGDLTGVTVRTAATDERRWIRLGRADGEVVEVLAGLRAGDRVVVPMRNAPDMER